MSSRAVWARTPRARQVPRIARGSGWSGPVAVCSVDFAEHFSDFAFHFLDYFFDFAMGFFALACARAFGFAFAGGFFALAFARAFALAFARAFSFAFAGSFFGLAFARAFGLAFAGGFSGLGTFAFASGAPFASSGSGDFTGARASRVLDGGLHGGGASSWCSVANRRGDGGVSHWDRMASPRCHGWAWGGGCLHRGRASDLTLSSGRRF